MNGFRPIFERGPKCSNPAMCSVQKKHFLFIVMKAKRINETCLSAERSRERKTGGGGDKQTS